MKETSSKTFDSEVWKKLADYEALQQGLCELIPLSNNIEKLLIEARVSDTAYYDRVWHRKVSVRVMLRIVRALVVQRNFYLNIVNQYNKKHKNG